MKPSVLLCVNSVKLCVILLKKLHRDPLRIHRVPLSAIITFLFLLLFVVSAAQDYFYSIHQEQNEFYKQFGDQPAAFYDSLNGYPGQVKLTGESDCRLQRIMFGFHPYWAGSAYLNYRWNLLSDLCYFSCEVDPSTGDPVTIHDWLTDPAIDSARAHGVRVHLCATIFSGHTAFFNNPAARQTLIDNLISLVRARNADGVNMDIEAMPSSVSDSMMAFMQDLSLQLKAAVPGAILSIDLPAVDWDEDFKIDSLSAYLDWFFIMAYDYYWSGSSQAGPVSPLFSMTASYDYSLSRTISNYESRGMNPDKLILGVPYYGRKWKTVSETIPSQTLGSSSALTYSNVRNNSGTYNASAYRWEPVSFSSCYIFFQNNNWYQCFIGLERDLREKYDIVNYRGLAGAGIWALSYDDGYHEYWQAISDKFTDCFIPLQYDTLYDSGGPHWNYYGDEDYTLTIDHGFGETRYMTFTSFGLEGPFDSLWLYAGPDTIYPMIGAYSGTAGPGTLLSTNGAFTLKFKSDAIFNFSGWSAVYHDGSMNFDEAGKEFDENLFLYPNPTTGPIYIGIRNGFIPIKIEVRDVLGREVFCPGTAELSIQSQHVKIDFSALPSGLYYLVLTNNSETTLLRRFMKY